MPRDLSSVRLARLNNLLRALASASIVTRELIEMLGNHTGRTLERDLDYLRRHFEARISWDPRRKGYILNSPGTFVMRLTLSEREATALVAGLAMTRHFLPHLDAACEALWGKIRTVLPEKLAAEASHLAKSAVVSLPISAFDPAIFETLLRAIRTGHPVRGRYTSPYDADPVEKPVMLSPWGVFFRAHAWYLWAWSHSSGGERTYRISRFTDLYITDEPAVAPEDRSVTGFAEARGTASLAASPPTSPSACCRPFPEWSSKRAGMRARPSKTATTAASSCAPGCRTWRKWPSGCWRAPRSP